MTIRALIPNFRGGSAVVNSDRSVANSDEQKISKVHHSRRAHRTGRTSMHADDVTKTSPDAKVDKPTEPAKTAKPTDSKIATTHFEKGISDITSLSSMLTTVLNHKGIDPKIYSDTVITHADFKPILEGLGASTAAVTEASGIATHRQEVLDKGAPLAIQGLDALLYHINSKIKGQADANNHSAELYAPIIAADTPIEAIEKARSVLEKTGKHTELVGWIKSLEEHIKFNNRESAAAAGAAGNDAMDKWAQERKLLKPNSTERIDHFGMAGKVGLGAAGLGVLVALWQGITSLKADQAKALVQQGVTQFGAQLMPALQTLADTLSQVQSSQQQTVKSLADAKQGFTAFAESTLNAIKAQQMRISGAMNSGPHHRIGLPSTNTVANTLNSPALTTSSSTRAASVLNDDTSSNSTAAQGNNPLPPNPSPPGFLAKQKAEMDNVTLAAQQTPQNKASSQTFGGIVPYIEGKSNTSGLPVGAVTTADLERAAEIGAEKALAKGSSGSPVREVRGREDIVTKDERVYRLG